VYRSQKAYRDNLDKLRNLFYHKYGVWCTISRFPGGSSNTVSRYNPGIMTKLTKKVHDWGYHYFDWNVDSNDAGGARSAAETFANFKKELCKGRANVVLMHDFANNDKTINALDRMIKYGKKNGYTFLPITASTGEIHHGVNN
jgi:peptidoglycan/xylan/chitin deacetylase (PgdA/CDA1 family)